MNLLTLKSVASTNSWLKGNAAGLPHGTVVLTHDQTAGRGQRGNSWEAEPGKNLTLSILLRPEAIHPSKQFLISEMVSLAVVDTLEKFLVPYVNRERITVKWPNDIYVNDLKIAGILIEHSITSTRIEQTIVGIGLNVNQTQFLSDAPNPVSMAIISNRNFNLDQLTAEIAEPIICHRFNDNNIHSSYLSRLWRADGMPHPFRTPDGNEFMATITDVSTSGMLRLRMPDNNIKEFAFKETAFVL